MALHIWTSDKGDVLSNDLPNDTAVSFGSGTINIPASGNIFKYMNATGASPGATGSDIVVLAFTIPANTFDIAGRELFFMANGTFGNNVNTKDVKIIFNPASATVGSAVGAGGTTIADTGSYSTTGAATWQLSAIVGKYGAAGSNTQIGIHSGAQIKATTQTLLAPMAITATESGTILVALTANAGTAASDIVVNYFTIQAFN